MILHFDFSTGASGDKILGALIEVCENLGIASFEDLERLQTKLFGNASTVKLSRKRLTQGGMQVTGISVEEDHPPHRHWQDIKALLEKSLETGVLTGGAFNLAMAAFSSIAEAEAGVHGVNVNDVHFHEIGAADSIIDICCSCFLVDRLSPSAVFATPLALGFGSFVCSHGEMPVPAPATTHIIKNLPVFAGIHKGELTTPTGAALARAFVSNWQPLVQVVPKAVGYGGGTRMIEGAANVVRVLAASRFNVKTDLEAAASEESSMSKPGCSLQIEGCALLETNIDHLSPESMAFACEELLSLGALDVWQESITMKKWRLAVRLCVLAKPNEAEATAENIIKLTGSLGVRQTYVERTVAARKTELKNTAFGQVAYKTAFVATPAGTIKLCRPEYEEVAQIARKQNLNFNKLYMELNDDAQD